MVGWWESDEITGKMVGNWWNSVGNMVVIYILETHGRCSVKLCVSCSKE